MGRFLDEFEASVQSWIGPSGAPNAGGDGWLDWGACGPGGDGGALVYCWGDAGIGLRVVAAIAATAATAGN